MPNYRKRNKNNRNKNKNKTSSSVKQESKTTTTTTTIISTSSGIEPNLPVNVQNSYTSTSSTSATTNIVLVVNVDEASNSSPLSNEEIDKTASNVDIDTLSDLVTNLRGSEDNTNSILKQSNFSSQLYSSSTSSSSSSCCSKKSTEIEDRQLDRAVFDKGDDSTLVNSVIRDTFVKDDSSSDKNSLKTGSANSKDASSAAAPSAADLPPATSESIESTRIDSSITQGTEVIESSKEDHSSKVIVHKVIVNNGSEKSEPSRVIVHQISKEDSEPKSQVIFHSEEESTSSSSHRAAKNGVDLSKKTSTKAAESSTTQTLSFSNVRGQPTRQLIYEQPRKAIVDNFSRVPEPSRAIIHQISRDEGLNSKSKVIVHQISKEEKQKTSSSSNESVVMQHSLPQTTDYTSIVHQISPTSPRSAKVYDQSGRVTDQSIFQQSFAESNFLKKNINDPQSQPSEHQKRVVLIPILQENSTQTSPLPSYSDNPLHSSLLEVIKDENSHPPSSHKTEVSRQMSSSPLSRSPVICFENLSKSFELNKDISEESYKVTEDHDESTQTSAPPTPAENKPGPVNTPEFISETSRKAHQKAFDHLEPLRIPSFPTKRPQKIILHPIINEVSGKPVFPYSENSLQTIDTSSKEIANKILKEVSSELKSSFMTEKTTKIIMEEEKTHSEPKRTSFPMSVKNQSSFRPGFFETDVFQKEINPLDIEAKVIVHKIEKENTNSPKSTDLHIDESKSSENRIKEKVIVHEISKEKSAFSNDLRIEETRSEEESYQSRMNKLLNETSVSKELKIKKENIDQDSKVIVHQISKEEPSKSQSESKTNIEHNKEKTRSEEDPFQLCMNKLLNNTSESKEFKIEKDLTDQESKVIVHQISREESAKSQPESKIKIDQTKDEPRVILHPITRSPSFPLASEINGESTKKKTTHPKDSFPVSNVKIQHPDQYSSKSTILEKKTNNFKELRELTKVQKINGEKVINHKILQTDSEPTFTSFPLAGANQKSPTGQSVNKNKPKMPLTSSFPISVEKETHKTQYTSRPEEFQSKPIDLQSLRDSADLRQSSSTMTSTYGLTETESKKEITHTILREEPGSDLPKDSIDQSLTESKKTTGDHFAANTNSRVESTDSLRITSNQPKEIIHPIAKEGSNGVLQVPSQSSHPDSKETTTFEDRDKSAHKEIIHKMIKEESSSDIQSKNFEHQTSQDESISSSEGSVLTAIHNESPRSVSPPQVEEARPQEPSEDKTKNRSFFLTPLELSNKAQPAQPDQTQDQLESTKVLNHAIVRQIEKPLGYRVESPQPEKLPMLMKKSKSFDDDDITIQEMSDTSSSIDTDNPPMISEAESSETDTLEANDDYSENSSLLNIQTLPMDQENDNSSQKSSPDYKSRRQQNRAALETHFLPQFLAPNFLDSIKEENSDMSDSDRRSTSSDRYEPPVQHSDLDDDVFHNPPKKANAVYPKSNLDFSKKHKHVLDVRPPKTGVIREETSPPSVVEAKIIDQGSIAESCSSWSTDCTPECEAAEVVYIESASSSVSDLLELDYSQGQQPADENDPSDVRIQTPTIDLESVNEMFTTCQSIESNDRKIFNPPTEKPPPPTPVSQPTSSGQEKINEQNLLPSHNKNDLPATRKANLEHEVRETRKNVDEIIFENKKTITETAAAPSSEDTQKKLDDVSAPPAANENSIANNSNSCDSAIEQIVSNKKSTSSTVSVSSVAVVENVVVGSTMENIRELVNTSLKSELDKIIDQTADLGCISKPKFIIGQPCSDHTLKSDTLSTKMSSSSSSSSSTTNNNTITNTTSSTKVLTLHDLSQALANTKHLHNPLVSPQGSFDSHGSDQSQCTAINLGSLPHSDWHHIDTTTDTTCVSESDTTGGFASSEESSSVATKVDKPSAEETESRIRKLRLLCTEALASMPYGQEVLEELASVAQTIRDMPYPLPELPQIKDIQLSLGSQLEKSSVITLSQVPPPSKPEAPASLGHKLKSPPPPPVPEPPSKYDSWLGVPSESDPNVLVCLSPSQRNAVKNDSTADSLLDMHKKFVERRGYHEYTTKQVNAINQANSTTSEAPKLSKIDSPPPPIPPRPPTVLTKSNGNTDTNDVDDEDDQNNHRLLAIIRDTHESKQQQKQHQQISSMTSTTSENISRKTESGGGGGDDGEIHHHSEFSQSKGIDKEFAKTTSSVLNKQSTETRDSEKMQQSEPEHVRKFADGETVLGMHFPTSEYFDSIFDGKSKRFSNIETSSKPTEYCSQILTTQPKRYSNIETSSFESKKYVENGKVLYDVSDSQREKIVEGDESLSVGGLNFPEMSTNKTNEVETSANNANRYSSGDSGTVMSAFKLNSTAAPPPPASAKERTESSPPAPPVPPLPPTFAANTSATSSKTTTTTSESHINRSFNAKTSGEKIVDDNFGQAAKEAAPTNTGNTAKKPSDGFQHQKLFKEFDDLSNLLKDELDSGKRRPPATLNGNDIPASVIDYNRVARESKIQHSHVSSTTSTETHRREQMKKLADEIDRTAKDRIQQRREVRIPVIIEKTMASGPRSAPILSSEKPRSYEIPVQVESDRKTRQRNYQQQRSYEIPVQVENESSRNSRQRTFSEHQSAYEIPVHVERDSQDRMRRAESMFNISDSSRNHLQHSEFMKYVGDLGSSENVCKPLQREVEICYLGRRQNIRAPRMSASTNDLSNIQTYDNYGAYDVRRTSQTTPRPRQPTKPSYLSTQSMIDTTPITSCVSARRSPAPERRSSLPREIHDRQMQYISSKEQQLKLEFERLENERRQLVDEMNRAQMNQRLHREAYRQRQLPPLTEDETFRQQMAEEWLNKVAEREERRLQKVIKISKINEEAGAPVAPPRRHSVADDIGDEFLKRVKERRSKLCMPSDSDWESGAESQPMPRTDGSRSETDEPPRVTVFEGHSTANINQLPKHLREFAKLTSQMKQDHREEITENSSSSASKMTSYKTTVKTTSNNHHESQTQSESQSMSKDGECQIVDESDHSTSPSSSSNIICNNDIDALSLGNSSSSSSSSSSKRIVGVVAVVGLSLGWTVLRNLINK